MLPVQRGDLSTSLRSRRTCLVDVGTIAMPGEFRERFTCEGKAASQSLANCDGIARETTAEPCQILLSVTTLRGLSVHIVPVKEAKAMLSLSPNMSLRTWAS